MSKVKLYIIILTSVTLILGIFSYGMVTSNKDKNRKDVSEGMEQSLSNEEITELKKLTRIAQNITEIRVSDMYLEDYIEQESRYKSHYSDSSIGKFFILDESVDGRYHDFKRYGLALDSYDINFVKFAKIRDDEDNVFKKYGSKYIIYVSVNTTYTNDIGDDVGFGEDLFKMNLDRLFYFGVNEDFKFEHMGDYYEE